MRQSNCPACDLKHQAPNNIVSQQESAHQELVNFFFTIKFILSLKQERLASKKLDTALPGDIGKSEQQKPTTMTFKKNKRSKKQEHL